MTAPCPYCGSPMARSGLAWQARLSPREGQILACIVEGLTTRQIARRLLMSEGTAKRHTTSLMQKMDAANRTQAAVMAVTAGYIEPEERGLSGDRPGRDPRRAPAGA